MGFGSAPTRGSTTGPDCAPRSEAAGQAAHDGADDAELLLAAYAAWGERFLDRVAGDFAFVLWDTRHARLLCACDQIGVVPLHYAQLGDRLLVASSPELLLLHPECVGRP